MLKNKVNELLQSVLEGNTHLFLIDFSIDSSNKITITLDGDNGVTVKDCMSISRAIDDNLDREEEDFSLEVASCGATSPLKLPRQYAKNIGRKLKVKLQENIKLEGDLTAADNEKITLEWKAREPKPIGKGKVTVQKVQEIAYNDIVEAKVVIKF